MSKRGKEVKEGERVKKGERDRERGIGGRKLKRESDFINVRE